jgi:RNA polymerase sigma-70 factor (ECF subfamily)
MKWYLIKFSFGKPIHPPCFNRVSPKATIGWVVTFLNVKHLMDRDKNSNEFSLDALRSGDQAEFARFVEAYSGYIFRLGLKMLRNEQDAEDVLQETFIKAYRYLPEFEGRSKLSTWLYRIATNEALMLIRRRRDLLSVDAPYQDTQELQEPLQIVDWCCLPEGELMSDEARDYLDKAVGELSDALRVVFILRDIDGLSTRDTAEVLDLSESAVKTRLSRARLQLRELLTQYYGEKVRSAELSSQR